ncbi:unnamed protein product, partial [Brassica oleracea var. botrytis]
VLLSRSCIHSRDTDDRRNLLPELPIRRSSRCFSKASRRCAWVITTLMLTLRVYTSTSTRSTGPKVWST